MAGLSALTLGEEALIRRGSVRTVLVAALAVFVVGCGSPDPMPSTRLASPPAATVAPALSPSVPPALTVSEALARRDAGELGDDPIVLAGYWTNRAFGHSCAPPRGQPGELELYCHDTEYGITERYEAIGELTPRSEWIPAAGPHLTPYVAEDLLQGLGAGLMGLPLPPVPIVVRGHFDDPRAANCRPAAIEACRDRLIVDGILVFDLENAPVPTPSPAPTPFPSPAPAALFGPDSCAGDVAYSFAGWTTTDELGIDFSRPGHVYAMITADPIPLGGGQLGRRICLSEDIYIGSPFDEVPITFAVVPGP